MQGYRPDVNGADDIIQPNATYKAGAREYKYKFLSDGVPESSIRKFVNWSQIYQPSIADQGESLRRTISSVVNCNFALLFHAGICAGCWAYAATSCLAYFNLMYCKNTPKYWVHLSEQQVSASANIIY